MEEKKLARALVRLRPHSPPTEGPLVSIVVTNRDGQAHLERLFDGLLKRTRYHPLEIVLVDNGSTDGSLELFGQWEGDKRLVQNPENQSFSVSNNQGIRTASGDLILLANNDLDPIHPDWLGYMVESLREDVTAVGAMLVYPRHPKSEVPPVHPDLTIQHVGVGFEKSQWGVRAVNTGAGDDPLAVVPGVHEVPATTAACLLARRSDLLLNQFDEHYWYGSEDWDLCLRLGNLGKVVVDTRAVLFHYEFGTQDRYMSEAWLRRRTENHRWFNELWGPPLLRRLRSEMVGEPSRWFYREDRAPKLSLISGTEQETSELDVRLSRQAGDKAWDVVRSESEASDLVVALEPPSNVPLFAGRDLSIAVVLDRETEWASGGSLDAAKRIIVPDRVVEGRINAIWGSGIAEVEPGLASPGGTLFERLLDISAPDSTAMRIGISTCAPDWERAQFWGDTFLARGLMRAFRRLGHEATELIVEDWHGSSAAACDVVLHLRGLARRPVARGQWNLLWIISHPDRLESDEFDDYDVVASASRRHAERLSADLGREVHYLPQATDTDTFKIGPSDVDYAAPVLYVGIGRWPPRRGPRWMMQNGRSFHLYGRFWENYPEGQFLRGNHIPNRDLASAYRSADVVVADHHGSMRTEGFVANRLFDVLASGGVVLSDDVAGLNEVFGDVIPTYANPQELESQLRVLLAEKAQRRQIAAEGRQIVMAGHTLDHRAREWMRLLDQV